MSKVYILLSPGDSDDNEPAEILGVYDSAELADYHRCRMVDESVAYQKHLEEGADRVVAMLDKWRADHQVVFDNPRPATGDGGSEFEEWEQRKYHYLICQADLTWRVDSMAYTLSDLDRVRFCNDRLKELIPRFYGDVDIPQIPESEVIPWTASFDRYRDGWLEVEEHEVIAAPVAPLRFSSSPRFECIPKLSYHEALDAAVASGHYRRVGGTTVDVKRVATADVA